MSYIIMLIIAAILALMSSAMTALGMVDLFDAAGMFILALFIIIDLGRFLLFNFTVNEWHNLRKVKYLIVLILILLFGYSAVGVYSKLDALVTPETKQAMVNAVVYNKANINAQTKQTRSEDLAQIAKEEYRNALDWNRNDLQNCIARARGNKNAENRCNNTKRALDNKASIALKEALAKADESLDLVEAKTKTNVENRNEIANVLMTICKLTQPSCDNYDYLQNSLTIVIILVIVGTDYLQIAIILAVNTRKNKKSKIEEKVEEIKKIQKKLPVIRVKEIEIARNDFKPIENNLEDFIDSKDENNNAKIEKVEELKEIPTKKKIKKIFSKNNTILRSFKFSGPKPKP